MTQYVINIGAIPNDGTGDPLRTAFNETNLNFDQVFAAGPVLSNIQIANNKILTTNTNGNLVLAPNGTGVVQSNVSILPNLANIRNLGSPTQRWATVYTQYINVSGSANIAGGNITIPVADLHILGGTNGYVLQTDGTGNLTWTAQTGGSGNGVPGGANTQIQFNDAGAFGGVAGFTFDKTSNVFTANNVTVSTLYSPNFYSNAVTYANATGYLTNTNLFKYNPGTETLTVGFASLTGNVTADYFIGNGSLLTGISTANTGNVTFNDINIIGTGNLHLQPDPSNAGSYLDIFLTSGPDLHLVASASANLILGKDDGANVMTSWNGNVYVQSWNLNTATPNTWTFSGDGSTIFPTLDVQRGDNPSGTIQGQTLLFGDAAQEAVISTPDGNPTDGINSQRLVINPGQGYGSGEGGDIYLWAGRGGPTDGSGGDVKIRGGQGMANGTGGYIRIEGGDTQGAGYPGYIDIKGGQGGTTQGAYVRITGGQGATNGGEAGVIGGYGTDVGGDANITAGYGGTNQGGNVNITGGGSALGLPGYGNVNVNAGASQWVFNNTGNLTLPSNSSSINYANGQPYGGTGSAGAAGNAGDIQINVAGNIGADSTLRYVDNGGEMTLYADYLNAPGIFTSDIYAGDGTPSNITLTTSYGNATWTFDTTGNLTLPGNIIGSGNILIAPDSASSSSYLDIYLTGGPDIHIASNDNSIVIGRDTGANIFVGNDGEVSIQTDNGATAQVWQFDNAGNLTIPGGGALWTLGAGTAGLTANIADPYQVNLGLDYASNTATLAGANSVVIQSNTGANTNQWSFSNTGNLNLPQGGWIGAAGVKGDGTMLTGGTGQIASLTSFYADAPGVYSGCVTVNPDGTLNITTYGNGTGVLGQWVFTGANLTVPGNSVVSTPNAESGLGGNSISIAAGAADQFNFNAYAGGNLNLTGGIGGFNDDGVGGPGGNVNISAGSSGEPGGHAGNVTINAGTNTWTFDYTGNVAVPGNLNYEGVASPAPSINGFDSVNVITVNATGNISATGNVSAGNLTTTGTVSATNIGNIASINLDGNASTVLYGNGVFAAVAGGGTYSDSNVNTLLAVWGSNTISTTGNITSGYLFGNGSQLTGLPATYGNSNVATFMAAYGSNTISTSGNITAGNAIILGNSSTGVYALDIGATATFLSNTVASFTANVNNYTQTTLQNLNTGADATADFILTANNGNDTVNYSDFGIINSGYDNATPTNSLGNIVFAADTYLYAQGNTGNTSQSGGNLAIGTTVPGKNVKIFAGGVTNSAIVANIGNTGVAVTGTVSATGNITTAGSFVGNGIGLTNVTVSAAGNIVGTQTNVSLVAGSYNWTFNNTGNLTLPGNTFSVNYANNTPVNVVTRFEGAWTVPVGNSTQSFTVSASETYYMWVDCNIPNGILTWNATATITNTNVPVVGAQYAWVYNGGGTPVDFTSIPNQFIGTSNTIVRSSVAPSSTTNRFDFGINNTSGGNVTVRYGWIQIS